MKKVLLFTALAAALTASLAQAGEKLVVAATPVPHAEILELIKPTLAKEGVDLEIKVFTDYVQPNVQVDQKRLDANYFQILPQKAGLIELKDPKNALATPKDIAKNPHNFKFKELESAMLPRVLDQVDLDMINTNYALEAGLNPAKDALVIARSRIISSSRSLSPRCCHVFWTRSTWT